MQPLIIARSHGKQTHPVAVQEQEVSGPDSLKVHKTHLDALKAHSDLCIPLIKFKLFIEFPQHTAGTNSFL